VLWHAHLEVVVVYWESAFWYKSGPEDSSKTHCRARLSSLKDALILGRVPSASQLSRMEFPHSAHPLRCHRMLVMVEMRKRSQLAIIAAEGKFKFSEDSDDLELIARR